MPVTNIQTANISEVIVQIPPLEIRCQNPKEKENWSAISKIKNIV